MITQNLSYNIVKFPLEDIPEHVLHEAKRSFLNWLGVAVGAHSHSSVGMLMNVADKLSRSQQSTVLGTSIKTDMYFAALINGMSSHIFDFDDTFLDTILHPSAPVFPALLAWAEHNNLPGKQFLQCFVIGVETEQRIAQSICPSHYNRGWHVTGSVGAFGSAAALGRAMGLDQEKMSYAIGLAGTQPTGLREMFGTMTKPFHPGKAAANGLLSALLANEGFTSSLSTLEALRGYCHVVSDSPDFTSIEADWGKNWLILKNSYKPYACGVVVHPAIDAAIKLKSKGISFKDIKRITLNVHPLVLELTGKKEPLNQLQAKFSVYHCTAVALIDGTAGEWQFSNERVLDDDVIDLRRKITSEISHDLSEDQVILNAELKDGSKVTEFIEHSLGSIYKPLADKDIEEKFKNLTMPYITKENQNKIIDLIWKMDSLPAIHEIINLCKSNILLT